MRRLAAGRESEILDLGGGRVLRRYLGTGNPEREALVMEHARRHGYPVPAVHEVRADGIVLERVPGPTMLAELRRRPWRLRPHAGTLAALHRRLHEIEAPPGVPEAGPGKALLHLDLHPDNVLLSPAGPVVVDWTNARRGTAELDVTLTWVIAATSPAGPVERALRQAFLRAFLAHFDRTALLEALPAAAAGRLADPNVGDRERDAVRRLLDDAPRR